MRLYYSFLSLSLFLNRVQSVKASSCDSEALALYDKHMSAGALLCFAAAGSSRRRQAEGQGGEEAVKQVARSLVCEQKVQEEGHYRPR